MARLKDPEKHRAILDAAVKEIAEIGLGAPTAKIAKRAGIAEGTLFTYFATKEELLNKLYLALKADLYTRIDEGFPRSASIERRAHHIWNAYLTWALEFPLRLRVTQQLHISTLLTTATREEASAGLGAIYDTIDSVDRHRALRRLPPGISSAVMAALQDATMALIAKRPAEREAIAEAMFRLFWRAVR